MSCNTEIFCDVTAARSPKRATSGSGQQETFRLVGVLFRQHLVSAQPDSWNLPGAHLPLLLFTSNAAISALYRRSGLKCCPKNGDVPKLPLSENGSTGANRQARKYLNN